MAGWAGARRGVHLRSSSRDATPAHTSTAPRVDRGWTGRPRCAAGRAPPTPPPGNDTPDGTWHPTTPRPPPAPWPDPRSASAPTPRAHRARGRTGRTAPGRSGNRPAHPAASPPPPPARPDPSPEPARPSPPATTPTRNPRHAPAHTPSRTQSTPSAGAVWPEGPRRPGWSPQRAVARPTGTRPRTACRNSAPPGNRRWDPPSRTGGGEPRRPPPPHLARTRSPSAPCPSSKFPPYDPRTPLRARGVPAWRGGARIRAVTSTWHAPATGEAANRHDGLTEPTPARSSSPLTSRDIPYPRTSPLSGRRRNSSTKHPTPQGPPARKGRGAEATTTGGGVRVRAR
ncbi:hypothetical protein ABIA38_003387 [Embleya sp. AB8]